MPRVALPLQHGGRGYNTDALTLALALTLTRTRTRTRTLTLTRSNPNPNPTRNRNPNPNQVDAFVEALQANLDMFKALGN